MKPVNIAFFWHMHQPYYLDPVKKQFLMPWVRLHSLKGYFDMISILEDFPKINQTFNLVPSLLDQIEKYVEGEVTDTYLELTLKQPSDLTRDERDFIIRNFFHANWDTMIKPYPRYWELLDRRRFFLKNDEMLNQFSDDDIRDLQVWFNLTWFGYMARRKFPFLNDLIKKEKNFTEDDKVQLIHTQMELIKQIVPVYKKFSDQGQVELTCSPFYHPILPLLYDTQFALRAMPHASLPDQFSFPQDVKAQIKKGIDYFEKLFGKKPKGMWPSEGSVCPELIPFFNECGIEWIATDEEILVNSIHFDKKIKALFKPYKAEYQGSSVNMIFRDRGLSDLIGFTYAKNKPEDAVSNFLSHIENIASHTPLDDDETLISVILDGENAWEYYPDGGEQFFRTLYKELSTSSHFKTVTVNDVMMKYPPKDTLSKLHSGSWINHNYGVWIGNPEENRAWNILGKVRIFFSETLKKNKDLPKDKIELAYEELYIAEGSDWFWWYGDIFSSENDDEFDRLFRLHLSNVYTILGYDVPDFLKIPIIISEEEAEKVVEPVGFISPVLDGIKTHFYEWQDAGFYEVKDEGGSMHQSQGMIQSLYYGFDLDNLYMRFDMNDRNIFKQNELQLNMNLLNEKKAYRISIDFEKQDCFQLFKSENDVDFKKVKEYKNIHIKDIIELSVPFKDLSFVADAKIEFFIELKKKSIELERVPKDRSISFLVPDEEFELDMWSV